MRGCRARSAGEWLSSDAEVAIAAQSDLTAQGKQVQAVRWGLGNEKKRAFGLVVEEKVLLEGVAVGAIVAKYVIAEWGSGPF